MLWMGLHRSALYAQAGATTLMSSAVTLLTVLVSLIFFTSSFYYIPKAALAAVICAAVWNLLDFKEFHRVWRMSRGDFWVMLATFSATFLLNSEIGLLVGIGSSMYLLLHKLAFSIQSQPYYHKLDTKGLGVVRLNCDLMFLNAARVKVYVTDEVIDNFSEGDSGLTVIVLDLVDVKHVDSSGVMAMQEIVAHAHRKHLEVVITNATTHVSAALRRAGIMSDRLSLSMRDIAVALVESGHHLCSEPVFTGSPYRRGIDAASGIVSCTYCSEVLTEYDSSQTISRRIDTKDISESSEYGNKRYV